MHRSKREKPRQYSRRRRSREDRWPTTSAPKTRRHERLHHRPRALERDDEIGVVIFLLILAAVSPSDRPPSSRRRLRLRRLRSPRRHEHRSAILQSLHHALARRLHERPSMRDDEISRPLRSRVRARGDRAMKLRPRARARHPNRTARRRPRTRRVRARAPVTRMRADVHQRRLRARVPARAPRARPRVTTVDARSALTVASVRSTPLDVNPSRPRRDARWRRRASNNRSSSIHRESHPQRSRATRRAPNDDDGVESSPRGRRSHHRAVDARSERERRTGKHDERECETRARARCGSTPHRRRKLRHRLRRSNPGMREDVPVCDFWTLSRARYAERGIHRARNYLTVRSGNRGKFGAHVPERSITSIRDGDVLTRRRARDGATTTIRFTARSGCIRAM